MSLNKLAAASIFSALMLTNVAMTGVAMAHESDSKSHEHKSGKHCPHCDPKNKEKVTCNCDKNKAEKEAKTE